MTEGEVQIFVTVMGTFMAGVVLLPMLLRLRVRGEWFDNFGGLGGRELAPTQALAALRVRDPGFSLVLFEDFLFELYARAQAARRAPEAMAALGPYVSERARRSLLDRHPRAANIHGVVIGRLGVSRASVSERVHFEVVFEANYTADLPQQGMRHTLERGFYVMETWRVERSMAVTSRPPEAVRDFHCPACGAPFVRSGSGACSYCKRQVDDGRFDWTVTSILLNSQASRPPALTGDVAEQGTNLPTVQHPKFRAAWTALAGEDPGLDEAIRGRFAAIYRVLNQAWSARDLRPIRPFVSDALFNYLSYWISAYRSRGLVNVLRDMEISNLVPVKVIRDRYFDAVTFRVFASGFDYTTNLAGKRLSGSDTTRRAYSEYWTLIRGAEVRGAARGSANCPNCGAGLERVNMAGNCEHCGAHMTRGEFDWVLSKIEQDDSYTG